MHFTATADTDIGISKTNNQDSVLIKHAAYGAKEVLLAVMCDGMGGLSKGELASATVIRTFSAWFDSEISKELENFDVQIISGKWVLMLKELNGTILEYGARNGVSLGTTFTGILFAEDQYVIVHVGDSRAYYMDRSLTQLTQDQTFIAREIAAGRMTPERAKTDPRRNMLLQCVGASKVIEPQVLTGRTKEGSYMLCSDGFRHVNTPNEIYGVFNASGLTDKQTMHSRTLYLIDQAKKRGERDNISVILIKAQRAV